jgi:SAM-dependent methyltransferase
MPGWFNAFFDHFQSRVIRGWVRACRFEPGMTALDIGCGTGRWAALMNREGQRTVGVDLGFNALRFAGRQWGRSMFVLGKLPRLCFAGETFHWAVSVTVLQHLPPDDQERTLEEIHRLLKPGGYLMLCESIDLSDKTDYLFPNSPAEWEARLARTGFEVVSRRGCEFIPFIKGFHWLRDRRRRSGPNRPPWTPGVSSVAASLEQKPMLALLVRVVLVLAFPAEYLAGWVFPRKWARLGCYLVRKRS